MAGTRWTTSLTLLLLLLRCLCLRFFFFFLCLFFCWRLSLLELEVPRLLRLLLLELGLCLRRLLCLFLERLLRSRLSLDLSLSNSFLRRFSWLLFNSCSFCRQLAWVLSISRLLWRSAVCKVRPRNRLFGLPRGFILRSCGPRYVKFASGNSRMSSAIAWL